MSYCLDVFQSYNRNPTPWRSSFGRTSEQHAGAFALGTSMGIKQCTKCGALKPLSEYHRDNSRKDGRHVYCKSCKKEYYQENREKLIERTKKWQKDNWDHYIKYQKEYQSKNYQYSPLKYIQSQREQSREYYRKNKDKIARKRKQRRERNKNKIRRRKLAAENRRRAARSGATGNFTDAEFKLLCNQYDNRCLRCGERKRLTADHVVPLSRGGSNDITNIQPLCKPCNSIKHTRTKDYRTKPFPKHWRQQELFDG